MRLLATALFLLTGLAVVGVLAEHFRGDGGFIARIGISALLSFLVVLVHELGHAAAVVRLGGRVSRIVVVPFKGSDGSVLFRRRPAQFAPSGEKPAG